MSEINFDGISLRRDFGLWWPNYDHAPEACFKRVMTRVRDLDETTRLVHVAGLRSGIVVQAGGHAGIWPAYLARNFSKVFTFEPEPKLFACLVRNVVLEEQNTGRAIASRIFPQQCALSDGIREMRMQPHPSAGSWRIKEGAPFPVQAVTIDSLALHGCDAIVLDIELHEREALLGAHATIARFRPVIHLEISKFTEKMMLGFMHDLGYLVHKRVHSDVIFVPGERL